ncbi:MAG: arylsulfatase [Gemmatimonadetes bacterium]|nr:arylsulfatase [Gemmatimonadota bacterium]MYB71747.1 arylsulfatase [Gemmatimonadota bacterium]
MTTASQRPNIVLILADDMGYSDLGCYGSEIRTPNLDGLAAEGLRFSQMYNFARCCLSRAALLTGLYPHQAGIGHMAGGIPNAPGYGGYLRHSAVTIAQILKERGYRTLMSGKWHCGKRPDSADIPPEMQHGFDRLFGLGRNSGYFGGRTCTRDGEPIAANPTDFYLTDAISNHAVDFISESADQPFFMYVAYTAPHWPLHAFEEDIARYQGQYRKGGWDAARTARHEALKDMEVVNSRWDISPRDEDAPPWHEVADPDWEDRRMAVYAAQVDRMDQGIGRILAKLRELDLEDNTIVVFLSDNGGCAEFLCEDGNRIDWVFLQGLTTHDGRPVQMGNIPGLMPGAEDTYMSYDVPWANVSTTPFRRYKRWVHEGGIATPCIVRWPATIKQPDLAHAPAQIIDITATLIDAAGASYPAEYDGHAITPLEGESFLALLEGREWSREKPMYWEHEGNAAVRIGPWKLVCETSGQGGWELYNMDEDRTELNDLAEREKDRVREMEQHYREWADRADVLPWPINPGARRFPGMNQEGTFYMRGQHGHMV